MTWAQVSQLQNKVMCMRREAVRKNTFWCRNKSSLSMLREDKPQRENNKLKPQTSVGKMSGNVLTASRIILKIFCCPSCWSFCMRKQSLFISPWTIHFDLLNCTLKQTENKFTVVDWISGQGATLRICLPERCFWRPLKYRPTLCI